MEVGTILAVTVLQGVVQVVEVLDTEVVQQHCPWTWVEAVPGLLHTVVPLQLQVVTQWVGPVRAMGPRTTPDIEPGPKHSFERKGQTLPCITV